MADLYKEPENSKKGWLSGTWFSHDKAILGAWKLQKDSKFFQEPENAKKAHIQAPEIANDHMGTLFPFDLVGTAYSV